MTVTFEAQPPLIASNAVYPKSLAVADLDGDNTPDLVAATLADDRVIWFPNLDGQGNYGSPRVVSDVAIAAASVTTGDVDNDGDIDVVSGGAGAVDSDVSWYENDGQGNFGPQQVISADVQGTDSVHVADLDGDGDLDVLSASRGDNKVAWYENIDGRGTFSNQVVISDQAEGATSIVAGDLDGDGDLDVVAASYTDDSIRWFENDGLGNFSIGELLTETASGVTAVELADLNADTRLDVVFTSRDDNTVGWFPNRGLVGGQLQFGPERVISLDDNGPNELFVGDFNGDQLLDVAVAARLGDRITWYANLGGGLFGSPQVVESDSDGASAVVAVDADADGDLDLFAASRFDNKIAFYRNLDGTGVFSDGHVLTEPGALGPEYVHAGDVDDDGDLDVLVAAFTGDQVTWFENLDGRGTFGPAQIISDRTNGPIAVLLADVDGDGDQDALSASYNDSKLAWYENLDGQGDFGPQRTVSGDALGINALIATDMDGDDDVDLVSVSRRDNKVAWYENTDGQGTFGAQVVVATDLNLPNAVAVGDLDGDGDLDIIANEYTQQDASITWFENVNGRGVFGPGRVITFDVSLPTDLAVADIDGDGDLDVVGASGADDRLLWFENLTGDGDFDDGRLISDQLNAAYIVRVADFDLDGDPDVVASAVLGGEISWFENEDGLGTFGAKQSIAPQIALPTALAAEDLDGDGDPDLVVAANNLDQVFWFRNQNDTTRRPGDFNDDGEVDIGDLDLLCVQIRSGADDQLFDLNADDVVDMLDLEAMLIDILQTNYGDADLDGSFTSLDMIAVLAANEYEDDIPGNSTWAEGDWNCDGDVTSDDLLLAIQTNTYESAALPAPQLDSIAAATLDTTVEQRRQLKSARRREA